MIELHNITVNYSQKDIPALSMVDLNILKGEFVFLAGPSGAGKTTLLKLLYGEIQPEFGNVIVDNMNVTKMRRKDIPFLRRNIGVVFQDFKLLPERTVLENVAITLEVLGADNRETGKKVYHILKKLGIEHKINSTPSRLSGGEQQRVAVARALVNEPKILLADEPTGNLDDSNKDQILGILRDANIQGTTVIMATHDQRIMSSGSSRLIFLDKGQVVENMHG